MKNLCCALICTALVLSISISQFPIEIYAQSQSFNSASKTTSGDGKSVVSVSASITVQVSNESLKAKEGMLRSSVIGFLNSGPNVLKTPESDQANIKSKIVNQINNATQNVQGLEATNAIVGVEVSKALKSLVASSDKPNQTALVTIKTASTCNSITVGPTSCDNTVTIQ